MLRAAVCDRAHISRVFRDEFHRRRIQLSVAAIAVIVDAGLTFAAPEMLPEMLPERMIVPPCA